MLEYIHENIRVIFGWTKKIFFADWKYWLLES